MINRFTFSDFHSYITTKAKSVKHFLWIEGKSETIAIFSILTIICIIYFIRTSSFHKIQMR